MAWGTAVIAAVYDDYNDYYYVWTNIIYTSLDFGTTWQQISTPPLNASPLLIASSGDGTVLALTGYSSDTNNGAIFTSTDSGETWNEHVIATDFVPDGYFWTSLVSSADGTRLLATGGPFIYISKNSGATWSTVKLAPFGAFITGVASSADGTRLAAASIDESAGFMNSAIYKSIDSGASWIPVLQNDDFYSSVASSADGTKLVAGGRLIYTQNSEPSLLTLANLCNNIYSGDTGYTDFQFADDISSLLPALQPDPGFKADAYTNSDQTLVIAFRGTVLNIESQDTALQTIKTVAADVSFGGSTPNFILQDDIFDAASFVQAIQDKYPNATIILAGHSLGGALAQLVAEASGLPAAVFNAVGGGALYDQLEAQLRGFAVLYRFSVNVTFSDGG